MNKRKTETWTVRDVLLYMEKRMKDEGIPDSRLSAELIISKALGLDRVGVYLNLERPLSKDERNRIRSLFKRRLKREPMAYIMGEREFFSVSFAVEPGVLIPRPETETLVETFMEDVSEGAEFTGIDLGSGCGAIGITILIHRKNGKMVLSDISRKACNVSRKNAESLGVSERAAVVRSQWLKPFKNGSFNFIVSNPPYVKKSDVEGLQEEIKRFEPLEALLGGKDGLDAYREISLDTRRVLKPGGRIYLEVGDGMEKDVKKIFSAYRHIKTVKDLSGTPRVLVFEA